MPGSGSESSYPGDDEGPYFFLSYAHTPRIDSEDHGDPNAWVFKLFRDLSADVIDLTSIPSGRPPGFMDRELRPGNDWPRRITEALATCRVFLALYSPRYFSSESCGKEWYAFHKRQEDHFARRRADDSESGLRRPEAVIPVLWVPVGENELPQAARAIHFNHHLLGDLYAQSGFSQMIKISRYEDDYRLAVRRLAEHIVRVAHANPVAPAEPSEFSDLDCAFGSEERRRSNNKRLQIIVVTDDYYHLPDKPVKRVMEYYNPSPVRWNPYRATSVIPLAEYASDLARGMGFAPDIVWFDQCAPALLDPGAMNDPGLMLIDPWATLNPERSRRLQQFDQLPKPWIQLMVPWNSQDSQTVLHDRALRDGLDTALHVRTTQSQTPAHYTTTAIPTFEIFGNVLPAVVNQAVRHYLGHTEPTPPDGPKYPRPPRLRDMSPQPPDNEPPTAGGRQ